MQASCVLKVSRKNRDIEGCILQFCTFNVYIYVGRSGFETRLLQSVRQLIFRRSLVNSRSSVPNSPPYIHPQTNESNIHSECNQCKLILMKNHLFRFPYSKISFIDVSFSSITKEIQQSVIINFKTYFG